MEHYDVVIVGTGAGGGTLARHLAPSGKKILLLERGDWLTREPENWSAEAVFVDNRYVSPETWYDEKGKAFQPQIHYFVGGATKLYGAALYRLRPEDFGELRHHDGVSPAWPISYDELEPYYLEGRAGLPGARQPRRGPDRGPVERRRTRIPAVSHEPRIQQLSDALAVARLPPVPRAVRDHARRGEAGLQRVRALRELRRLPVPRARQVGRGRARRAAGARAPERHAADERAGREARHERGGHGGDRGRRRPRRRRGALLRRRRRARVRRGQHREAAARLGERPPPERPRERLRPGRPQLHVPQQPGRARALARGEPDDLPEDPRASTTSTSRATSDEFPLGNIQMVGKSQAPMFRGEKPIETKLAPGWSLERVAKHAIDFWLSTEDLPRRREPRHGRPRRQGHARLHGDERRARRTGSTRSSSRCSACST